LTTFPTLLLVSLMASALDDGPATELKYSGSVAQLDRGTPKEPSKRFEAYCLLINGDSRDLAFFVSEQGSGAWAWPERFGRVRFDADQAAVGKSGMKLLYTHDGTKYPHVLRLPLFPKADRLKEGASWVDGKRRFEITRTRKVAGRDCWQIEVSNNFGRNETLWVERNTPLVVKSERRLFMGRGDQFVLTMELESAKTVNNAQLTKLKPPVQTLLKLHSALNRAENETKPELNAAQLKTAKAAAVVLAEQSSKTAFQPLATAIGRDVALQLERLGGIAALAKKFVGQKSPALTLTGLDGKAMSTKETTGRIVVLHFWDYRGDPLTEPYGQVGYLDFFNLQSSRRKFDVKVVGVAVDPRLGDRTQKSAALRSIRKLQTFMNISYPIAIDDGALLRKFGDPQRLGAKLPLWVVLDSTGKIVHYKSGFYDIKPDEGLRELEAVVVGLVRKQRGK
jgi:alkyl hydroperoxide reductase subunit AhpC